jgi:ankyrin repeat protein
MTAGTDDPSAAGQIIKLLLAAGGDVNAKDPRGLTPLHEAARWGWNDVVKFLVANGADVNAKDTRGNTVVDSALGKAGGNSRGGQRIDVHDDTAALLKQLIAAKP